MAEQPAPVTLNGANFQPGSQVKIGGSTAIAVNIVSQNQITATLPALSAGTYTVQVVSPSNVTASLKNGFTYKSPSSGRSPLSIATTSLPGATVNQTYSTSLSASGGKTPYTWSILSGSLPPGLTLTAAGRISGTPTEIVNAGFTLEVQDATGKLASAALTLNVAADTSSQPSIATLTSVSPSSGTANEPISATLTGTNFQTGSSVKVGGDTATNVTLVSSTKITATLPGMSAGTYTIQLVSPDGTAVSLKNAVTYTAPLSISTTSLSTATVGQSYTATLSATGGSSPYSWSVLSGSLPAGLTMSPAGAISGTPSTAATSTFKVQVQDSANSTATESLQLNVVSTPASGSGSGSGTGSGSGSGTGTSSGTPTGTAITSCQTITNSGTYYLANDVTCTTQGFSINASNVVFNLNGHTITYGNPNAASAAFMFCDSYYHQESTTNVALPGCSGSGAHQNPEIYGGTIVQAPGTAPFSPVIWIGEADGMNGGKIHDLTATFSSTGSQFIHGDFPGTGWTIANNVINDNVTNIQLPGQDPLGARSHFQGQAIDFNNSALTTGSGNIFQNNTINGSPQGGIRDTSPGSQYLGNKITLSSWYSNDYGIVMYANNQTASNNVIQGRGRGIDAEYSNFTISSNQITVHEETNNSEYGGCELEGSYGIRVKNYAPIVSTGGLIENNTVTVAATYCQAAGLDLTDLAPQAQITISNNTFTTTPGTGGQIDAALSIEGSNNPQITYTTNTWNGTYDVFCNWDGCGTTIQPGQKWIFTGDTVNASDGNDSSTGEMGPFPDFVSIGDTVPGASVVCGTYSTTAVTIGSYTKTCTPTN